MKVWSLRSRIVIMASIVVAAACLFLTAISITSANRYMRSVISYDTNVFSSAEEEASLLGNAMPPAPISSIQENRVAYRDTMTTFSQTALLSMFITIVILAAAIFLLTGKLLAPLSCLTHSICGIDEKNLRQRVELPQAEDEVYSLTQAFNNMMDRLEHSYMIQKNFAANAAHELKTPLAVIKTSLQVLELQENPGEEDYMEFADDVKYSLDRLIKTVESLQLLTDSSLKDETETINVLTAATEIQYELSGLSEEKNVKITVNGSDWKITYNKELFYRILRNLIENAVKYNRPGGSVNITVSRSHNAVCVKDNGIGMDEQAIQHIFEPFYRSDLSRSQKVPGCGLGMSIVKTVMDRYGGTLEIDSTLGEGTEITFKL